MNRKPSFRNPPGRIRVKRVAFRFENGKEVFSTNLSVAKALWEKFRSEPEIDKKNAYLLVGEKVVFLERVNEIFFNLEDKG